MSTEQIKTRVKRLATMLAQTSDDECDCDQVFLVMDHLVELHAAGIAIGEHIPTIQHHLDLCGCCRAEYEALQLVLGDSVTT